MTIILDPDTGKFFSLFWGESDNFEKVQKREITMEQVRESCAHNDYVKIQRLEDAMKEEALDSEKV